MPFDISVTSRHFQQHCNDLPCTVQIGGIEAAASKGSNIVGKQFLEAGGTLTYDFSVWLPKAAVVERPQNMSRIEVDGEEYRVGNIEEYADGAGWRLDLGHPEDYSL